MAMSFDLLLDQTEERLRMDEVAGITRTCISTVFRWITRGVPAGDRSGRRVRLEAVRCGRTWVITRKALEDFARSTTPTFDVNGKQIRIRTPKARKTADKKATKKLAEMGVA
jgi:hypothetical protein